MTKGEQTRQHIIQQAAVLFNQRGYTASSISDVMLSTGLQKGGIYRHFGSKEKLVLAAFDYVQQQSTQRLELAAQAETHAIKQLLAIINAFHASTMYPALPGGCPVFNTIADCDNGDPVLRERALAAVTRWEQLIERIIVQGVAQGVVRTDINPQAVATLIISTVEGAIFLSRIHGDAVYVQHAVDHLTHYVQRDVATTSVS